MKQLLTLLLLGFAVWLHAQEKGLTPIQTASSTEMGSTYAVVVGISDYQDAGIPDLRFADKDAEAFANFLRSPGGGELDDDHLNVLTNDQATAGRLAEALDALIEQVVENDRVFIYFSGHGDVEGKKISQPGFLLCWDAPARVYMGGGTYSLAYLQEVVSTLSVQNGAKVFVITDACHAGKLAGNQIGGAQLTSASLAKQFANEVKILSCQPNEYSLEGEQWGGGRGCFSYHLIDGLSGLADRNSDGVVSMGELDRYLEDHVTSEAAPQSQVPMLIGSKTDRLATVNAQALADLQDQKKGRTPIFDAIASRGFEDEVLAKVAPGIQLLYQDFKQAVDDKRFYLPAGNCAEDYYKLLVEVEEITPLRGMMKRNYAAALQDEAQQVLNKWMSGDVTELSLSKFTQAEKYRLYPRYLARAAELLGEGHYMYPVLKARSIYFEAYLMHIDDRNEDLEFGKKIIAKYREVLRWQSELPYVFYSLEWVYFYQMRQVDSAEYYAHRATELAPSWLAPFSMLGFMYTTKNNVEKADLYLEMADSIGADLAQSNLWHLNNWGNYYRHSNQMEKAEETFKKCIELDSTIAVSYCNLGIYYADLKRYTDAEMQYEKAIQLDSTSALHQNNLGHLYVNMGRFVDAGHQFEKAIQLDSTLTSSRINLGIVYRRVGRFTDAEQQVRKAIQLDSSIVYAYNFLGTLYVKARRYTEAEQQFKKVFQLDSTYWVSYANLGLLYQSLQRWEESEAMILKAIAFGPSLGLLYAILGNACTHLPGRLEDAKTELDKALQMDANYPDTYIYLTQWSLKKNRMEEAWQYFEQGLEKGIEDGELKLSDLQEGPDFAEMRKEAKWGELIEKYFPDQKKE